MMADEAIRVRVGVVSALIVVALAACAQRVEPAAEPAQDSGGASLATGRAYAEEVGIVRHEIDESMKLTTEGGQLHLDGVPLEGCDTRPSDGAFGVQAPSGDGGLYCFTADDSLELWVIHQRLAGHVPTDAEIAEKEAELIENGELEETL